MALSGGQFNLTAIPAALNDRLMFNNMAVAEFFTMFLVMVMVLVVVAFFTTELVIVISVEILTLLFGVVIGWIDPWVTLIISMAVAGLWTFGFWNRTLGD